MGPSRGGVGWVIVEEMGENNRCYSYLSQMQMMPIDVI